jgi:ATP-dependent DNA ligase
MPIHTTLNAVTETFSTLCCGIFRHPALWLKPVLVGQFEFVEWTEDAHLRHSRFVGLREDKPAKDVRREVT